MEVNKLDFDTIKIEHINNVCGIYIIRNILNNNFYIGSTKNLLYRKNTHFNELRKNKHSNRYLQNAFNKYSEENFIFEVIELCEINERLDKEQMWLDRFFESDICYNINPIADIPPNLKGAKFTEEHKQKISKALIGNKNSLGAKRTQEFKNIISKIHKGHKHSIETKEKLSALKKGQYIGANNPNSKSVIRLSDNRTYCTIVDCAKDNNIHPETVSKHCKNKVNNPKFKFK